MSFFFFLFRFIAFVLPFPPILFRYNDLPSSILETNTIIPVECPKECGSERAFFMQIQIRSADEPSTTFYKLVYLSLSFHFCLPRAKQNYQTDLRFFSLSGVAICNVIINGGKIRRIPSFLSLLQAQVVRHWTIFLSSTPLISFSLMLMINESVQLPSLCRFSDFFSFYLVVKINFYLIDL